MKYKFNIGDRVRVLDGSKIEDYTGGWCMEYTVGEEGVITDCTTVEKTTAYKIKFDNRELGRFESCNFDERGLEPVGIHITFSIMERRVISRVYDSKGVIAESEARCHPDDEFDLKTGIRIALDRLLAEISLYNGKVVCVENNGHMRFAFTKGKIYTIANGEIEDDCEMIPFRKIKSLNEFDEIEGLRFIPLVE